MIIHGDSLHELTKLDDNSIDAVVSDPPYGLSNISHSALMSCLKEWALGNYSYLPAAKGFMGKSWDGFVPPPALWREVYRVMKPGAHALIFAGSRTQDLMGLSLRVAGFEIRDILQWLYGSGFPKSHDVSKAIDKVKGAKREIIGYSKSGLHRGTGHTVAYGIGNSRQSSFITAPASPQAKQWDGWGTALKPAYEPILLVRKPLIGSVAENVLKHGTGGINIDACRIDSSDSLARINKIDNGMLGVGNGLNSQALRVAQGLDELGRYPSNVILDERASNLLDIQAPSVNRFFYCAKAQPKEREAGLDGLRKKTSAELTGRKEGAAGLVMKHRDGSEKANPYAGISGQQPKSNIHPTVKPIELMKYLCKLITPPGGTILEPFLGSGTTAIAANLLGFECIGIERELEYVKVAEARLKYWTLNYEPIYSDVKEDKQDTQLELF
jgi:DNA modification methylase